MVDPGPVDPSLAMDEYFVEACSLVDYDALVPPSLRSTDALCSDLPSIADLVEDACDDASLTTITELSTCSEGSDSLDSFTLLDVDMPAGPVQAPVRHLTPSDAVALANEMVALLTKEECFDSAVDDLDQPPLDLLYTMQHLCRRDKMSVNAVYGRQRRHLIQLLRSKKLRGLFAHFDGGASASTTNRIEYLWFCRALVNCNVRLRVADGSVYTPSHQGYLCVPTRDGEPKFVPCFYTPEIDATIVSPFRTCEASHCRGVSTYVSRDQSVGEVTIHHPSRTAQDVIFSCQIFQGLLYSEALVKPSDEQRIAPLPKSELKVRQVRRVRFTEPS